MILVMSLLPGCGANYEVENNSYGQMIVNSSENQLKLSLAPADITCQKDYQCRTVEFSCCPGGEIGAINKANYISFRHNFRKKCKELKAKDTCPKGAKHGLFLPKAQCVEQKCIATP